MTVPCRISCGCGGHRIADVAGPLGRLEPGQTQADQAGDATLVEQPCAFGNAAGADDFQRILVPESVRG